jgi:hypothetical protein
MPLLFLRHCYCCRCYYYLSPELQLVLLLTGDTALARIVGQRTWAAQEAVDLVHTILSLPFLSYLEGSLGHAEPHDANVACINYDVTDLSDMSVNGKTECRDEVNLDTIRTMRGEWNSPVGAATQGTLVAVTLACHNCSVWLLREKLLAVNWGLC